MDNENILDYIKFFEKLEKNKKKVKTIEIGLNFLDLFYKELNELELLSFSSKEQKADITTIKIFNFVDKKFKHIKVNSEDFQDHLRFFYRTFVDKSYFSNFFWYKNFSINIKETLEKKYNYNSISAINLVVSFTCDCFKLFSNGNNEYDFETTNTHLIEVFMAAGFNIKESTEFSNSILKNLFDEKLLLFSSNIFSLKKKFKLSDPLMDIVFNVSSMFIAKVSSLDKYSVKYNPKIFLEELPETVHIFNNNWHHRTVVVQLMPLMFRDYPELMKELLDYSILNINPDLLKNVPDNVLDAVKGFFFYKVILNEYFFQSVIVSCFDYYFLHPKLKNILSLIDYTELFYKK